MLQNSPLNSNRNNYYLPYPSEERQRAQGEQSFCGLWLLEITCQVCNFKVIVFH